jgi:hypothetical protein
MSFDYNPFSLKFQICPRHRIGINQQLLREDSDWRNLFARREPALIQA